MIRWTTADEAVSLIPDGATIGVNAFLTIANPRQLHEALNKRVRATGHPRDLTLFCSAAIGDWTEDSLCESYIEAGAVSKVILGHMSSMPVTGRLILEEKMEGYNLPLGVLSHMVRAAAAGHPYYMTHVGLNLFVDPTVGKGYQLNERSTEEWVRRIEIDGAPFLLYKTPRLDVAFVKGTSADSMGNISFEKECATIDALPLIQAVKRRGGQVIAQVERVIKEHQRPRNVIIPGILVDTIAVCPQQEQILNMEHYEPTYSGDTYVPPQEMEQWVADRIRSASKTDPLRDIIASRAVQELSPGQIANIGIGIPESVAMAAARKGILKEITLTVESGAIGGLPATGYSFGASVGADTIYDMAQQFDFYDGGGLDICFVGALEVDRHGNVNSHHSEHKLSGIGGFANITQSTHKVVFCVTFSAGGLAADTGDGAFSIRQEGRYPKFVRDVSAVSFSAHNAHLSGQEVLYITERCVFRLGNNGLRLCEVAPGVDVRRDILDKLPFPVEVDEPLRKMPCLL